MVNENERIITLPMWKNLSDEEKKQALTPMESNHKFNMPNDSIEWARYSWNPVTGCLHNCGFCYARDMANRMYGNIDGDRFQPVIRPERLLGPSNTKPKKKKFTDDVDVIGHRNVFTCSMADLFGSWVPDEWIDAVIDVVIESPDWNFIMLTKNPKRYLEFEFPDNVWLGVTVTMQKDIKTAEDTFEKLDAKVKFLSCEPMLEELTFSKIDVFNWVIIGGQSRTTKSMAFHPERRWLNKLEDQAIDSGCAVYEKTNLLERIREYPDFM